MTSRKLSIAFVAGALLTAVGSGAFASDKWLGDRGDNWLEHVKSTKSRAQVIAELNEARAQGLVGYSGEETNYPKAPVVKSTRSRSDVQAEAAEATKNRNRSIEYSSGQ